MSIPTAYCLVRNLPPYRHEAFIQGLKRTGFAISKDRLANKPPNPHDILIIWNRYGHWDAEARRFERAGARVIVAENGYLPMRGTKKTFALALKHHNGAGEWSQGDTGRRALLDVELSPWREGGTELVVLPQRGIGPPGVAMPRTWPVDICRRLASETRRRVRVRPHPGGNTPPVPLEEDLAGAWAAVTWGSGAALKALVAGVPVFHEFPSWIGRWWAQYGIKDLEKPYRPDDRDQLLERVAQAQCTVEELESGEAIKRLLGPI